jgi:hypothetical protein
LKERIESGIRFVNTRQGPLKGGCVLDTDPLSTTTEQATHCASETMNQKHGLEPQSRRGAFQMLLWVREADG